MFLNFVYYFNIPPKTLINIEGWYAGPTTQTSDGKKTLHLLFHNNPYMHAAYQHIENIDFWIIKYYVVNRQNCSFAKLVISCNIFISWNIKWDVHRSILRSLNWTRYVGITLNIRMQIRAFFSQSFKV